MFFRSTQFIKQRRGFTLIEMIVVIGIFTVITGVLLADLPGFRKKSSLDMTAQEVATYLRGAQVYGSSVYATGGASVEAYGLTFNKDVKDYNLYPSVGCSSACTLSATPLERYRIAAGYNFVGFFRDGPTPVSGSLSVIFKRPRMEAMFQNGGSLLNTTNYVTIKIQSEGSNKFKCINIYKSGQIEVTDTCP